MAEASRGRERPPPASSAAQPPEGSRREPPADSAADELFRDEEALADLRAAVDLAAAGMPAGPGERAARRPPLDEACKRLLEVVRRRCPGLLPADPLPPGEPAPPVPVEPKTAAALVVLAARQAAQAAAGGPAPTEPGQLPTALLWRQGVDELLVEVAGIDVQIGEGMVSVLVPVRCDQIPRHRARVAVDFAVGSRDRPAGLLAATTQPRGPLVVVQRWGDALTALAWQAVLDAAGGVAAAAGQDTDGAPLLPVALTAGRAGLTVQAQARHPVDRVLPGRVVHADPAVGAAGP